MTRSFEGERTLMRIFIGETDRCPAGPQAVDVYINRRRQVALAVIP